MRCYIEMDDASSLDLQEHKHVEHFEANRGNDKKVNGHDFTGVILEESPPRLGRRLVRFDHVFLHRERTDSDT